MKWNEPSIWRGAFLKDASWYAVAEDVFGYQFCLRIDGRRPVVKALSLWDGTFILIANSFTEFIERIVLTPTAWVSMRARYRMLMDHPSMQFRPLSHLTFEIPPLLNSEGPTGKFEWMDSTTNASILAQVFAQTKAREIKGGHE